MLLVLVRPRFEWRLVHRDPRKLHSRLEYAGSREIEERVYDKSRENESKLAERKPEQV